MKLFRYFFIASLFLLVSCPTDPDDDRPYVIIRVYNYSVEKIKIVSDEYVFSGIRKEYGTIDKDEIRTISVKANERVSAIGDVSGKNYGSRNFGSALTYDWVINR